MGWRLEADRGWQLDDLPVIKENIRQGFLETQAKVNTWVQNFKKTMDGEESEDDDGHHHARPGHGYNQGFGETSSYGGRRSTEARRSADRERYDADPQILSDNFSSLELRDNEGMPQSCIYRLCSLLELTSNFVPPAAPPPRPPRPQTKSQSSDQRKVSFQEGPPEEIGDLHSTDPGAKNTGSKSSKWQPLSTVEPSPVNDNDPFSLGDSDDEKETKNKDMKPEEAERVKKATEEAMSGEIGPDSKSEENTQDKPTDTKTT